LLALADKHACSHTNSPNPNPNPNRKHKHPPNQALMEQWRAELARKPLAMSEQEACATLGIKSPSPSNPSGGDGVVSEEDMRRAYRSLARRYHPDKNPTPEARAKFLAVQKAYERLQAGASGGQGPQAWRVQLMLRAQCILYGHYPEALAPFKYAGYPLLLEVLRQQGGGDLPDGAVDGGGEGCAAAGAGAGADAPAVSAAEGGGGAAKRAQHASGPESDHFLHGERVGLVQAAVELCWLTCVASALNAEELLRCGGCSVLSHLLSRCAGIMPLDVAPTAPEAVIATHSLRTLAGLAAVAAARRELEGPRYRQLLADAVRCCGLERAHGAVEAALMAVAQLAAAPALQVALVEAGALAYVVPLLLGYDSTLAAEAAARLVLPFGGGAGSGQEEVCCWRCCVVLKGWCFFGRRGGGGRRVRVMVVVMELFCYGCGVGPSSAHARSLLLPLTCNDARRTHRSAPR